MKTIVNDNNLSECSELFDALSKTENLRIFLSSKEGLRTNTASLRRSTSSRKRYYKTLKQLKDGGLIEKSKGAYFHTTFGRIVYQRNILEMIKFKKQLEGMKVVDGLSGFDKGEKFDEDRIVDFFEKLINISSSSAPVIRDNIRIIWNYPELVSILLKSVELCKTEILIATRISDDRIINSMIHKSRSGVKVKVIVDIDLVKDYLKLHITKNKQFNPKDKNLAERLNLVSNPWYPDDRNNKNIERRIANVPFSMIIIDGTMVGIEVIDRNDSKNFNMGILIRADENIAMIMKDYYQKIWNESVSDPSLTKKLYHNLNSD